MLHYIISKLELETLLGFMFNVLLTASLLIVSMFFNRLDQSVKENQNIYFLAKIITNKFCSRNWIIEEGVCFMCHYN